MSLYESALKFLILITKILNINNLSNTHYILFSINQIYGNFSFKKKV